MEPQERRGLPDRTDVRGQAGWLPGVLWAGAPGRGVSLALEAPRIMFTVVGIKSNNDKLLSQISLRHSSEFQSIYIDKLY